METLQENSVVEPVVEETPKFKIDLGCGSKKEVGWYGVDSVAFEGVDEIVDLNGPWPWADGSVDEIRATHVLEHFDGIERVHFMNELYRVLKDKGTAFIVCPHWSSQRAYGDPTHKWPPLGMFFCWYLSRKWRETDAPHTDDRNVPGMYKCNFRAEGGYGVLPTFDMKTEEAKQFAIMHYTEATPDVMFTLTKYPFDADF